MLVPPGDEATSQIDKSPELGQACPFYLRQRLGKCDWKGCQLEPIMAGYCSSLLHIFGILTLGSSWDPFPVAPLPCSPHRQTFAGE